MDGDGALLVLVVLVGVGLTWWLLRAPPPSALAAPPASACGNSAGAVTGPGLAGFAGYLTKGAVKLSPDQVCSGLSAAGKALQPVAAKVVSSKYGQAGLTATAKPVNETINSFQAAANGDFSGAANHALSAATAPIDALNKLGGSAMDLSCAQLKAGLKVTYHTDDIKRLSTTPVFSSGYTSNSLNDSRVKAAVAKGCA